MPKTIEHQAHLDPYALDLLGLRIALVQLEIGADLPLPFGGEQLLILADPEIWRRRSVGLPCTFDVLPRGSVLRYRFLRSRGLHGLDLWIVVRRFLLLVLRHHPIGLFAFLRRFLWQIGRLDLRLLLGQRRRGHGSIGVRTRRQLSVFSGG